MDIVAEKWVYNQHCFCNTSNKRKEDIITHTSCTKKIFTLKPLKLLLT